MKRTRSKRSWSGSATYALVSREISVVEESTARSSEEFDLMPARAETDISRAMMANHIVRVKPS
jgi:hypothetical protein